MLKVKTFLGCFKLETGGKIIGWLNMFNFVCGILIWAVALIFVATTDCDGFKKFSKILEQFTFNGDVSSSDCSGGRGILIATFALATVFSIGFFIITCYFIRGLNQKKHNHIKPMMVLMGFCTVSSLLNFFIPYYTIVTAISVTIIYAYEFVVVYSIHSKFSGEFSEAPPVYYQSEIAKV